MILLTCMSVSRIFSLTTIFLYSISSLFRTDFFNNLDFLFFSLYNLGHAEYKQDVSYCDSIETVYVCHYATEPEGDHRTRRHQEHLGEVNDEFTDDLFDDFDVTLYQKRDNFISIFQDLGRHFDVRHEMFDVQNFNEGNFCIEVKECYQQREVLRQHILNITGYTMPRY